MLTFDRILLYLSEKLSQQGVLAVSKNQKNDRFDFIRQYDAKLNSIYRRWEEQIENQAVTTQSKSLFAKAWSNKKTILAVGAMAFGSSIAVWRVNSRINSPHNFIYSNCQEFKGSMYAD